MVNGLLPPIFSKGNAFTTTSTPGRRSLCDRIGEYVNPTILMAENGRSILWMSCLGNPESVFETRIVLQLPLIPDVRIGKCPEILTIFALKHAHLPRIVGSTTIHCLENRSRGDCKLSMIVNTDRPDSDFCALNVRTKRRNREPR